MPHYTLLLHRSLGKSPGYITHKCEPVTIIKMLILTLWTCFPEVVTSLPALLSASLLTKAPTVSGHISTFPIPLAGELRQVGGALLDTTWLPRCCSARSSSSNEIMWAGTRFRRRWSGFRLQLVSMCKLFNHIPTFVTINTREMEQLWEMVNEAAWFGNTDSFDADSMCGGKAHGI